MASICCECGSLVKSLLKRLGISTSELKNSLKWMILKSPHKETKRKVVQLNYILSSIFYFVLPIIYIATFRNSVAQSHIGHSNLNFWWPCSVLTHHWQPCNCQFLALCQSFLGFKGLKERKMSEICCENSEFLLKEIPSK